MKTEIYLALYESPAKYIAIDSSSNYPYSVDSLTVAKLWKFSEQGKMLQFLKTFEKYMGNVKVVQVNMTVSEPIEKVEIKMENIKSYEVR